jgi:hypothetical protein
MDKTAAIEEARLVTGEADRGTEAGAERRDPAVDAGEREPVIPDPPPYLSNGPGFAPGQGGEVGTWVLHVRGGGAFALNAVAALSQVIATRPPGPSRDVFERICEAFIEASPDYDVPS